MKNYPLELGIGGCHFLVSSSRCLVALLGIAQRTVHAKFTQKSRKSPGSKPLPVSIQSIGNLIQVHRQAKNLTPGHLAFEMGIAATVVYSWEDGKTVPNDWQMKLLAKILGFNAKEFEAHTGKPVTEKPICWT